MHASWRTFLKRHGAHFSSESVSDFGEPDVELQAAENGTLLADLSSEGFIRVSGPDARTFLQGQISTNVQALTPLASQLTSWNNPKGRVVALMRLCEQDDAIFMALPRVFTLPVLKRLSMYVLRSKVALTDASDTLVHFGIAGSNAPGLLASCGWPVPAHTNAASIKNGVTLIRLHGLTPRFVLQGMPEELMSLWDAFKKQGAYPSGETAWTLLRILAREPVIYPETSEHFVAQMLGLEELGAIDFKKGCYIGQEVIARAHYRGNVKRHLHSASCQSSATVPPGTSVYASGTEQPVGEILDACRDLHGKTQMLMVIQDNYQSTTLSLPGVTEIYLME